MKLNAFQNYGLTSVPPAGSEAIIAAIGGQLPDLLPLLLKSCRPKGGIELDVCLYHFEGHNLLLTKDGKAIRQ